MQLNGEIHSHWLNDNYVLFVFRFCGLNKSQNKKKSDTHRPTSKNQQQQQHQHHQSLNAKDERFHGHYRHSHPKLITTLYCAEIELFTSLPALCVLATDMVCPQCTHKCIECVDLKFHEKYLLSEDELLLLLIICVCECVCVYCAEWSTVLMHIQWIFQFRIYMIGSLAGSQLPFFFAILSFFFNIQFIKRNCTRCMTLTCIFVMDIFKE